MVRLLESLGEDVERRKDHLSRRRRSPRHLRVDLLCFAFAATLQVGSRQPVLRAEVALQRHDRRLGRLQDAIDAHGADALIEEEVVRGLQESFPRHTPHSRDSRGA